MTTTDPTTRPIHERWEVADDYPARLRLDGEWCCDLDTTEIPAAIDLIAAAGKTHAALVNLPECAGGGQIVTWSHPNGTVEAAWRSNPAATWTPVDMLGGSVEVAP